MAVIAVALCLLMHRDPLFFPQAERYPLKQVSCTHQSSAQTNLPHLYQAPDLPSQRHDLERFKIIAIHGQVPQRSISNKARTVIRVSKSIARPPSTRQNHPPDSALCLPFSNNPAGGDKAPRERPFPCLHRPFDGHQQLFLAPPNAPRQACASASFPQLVDADLTG